MVTGAALMVPICSCSVWPAARVPLGATFIRIGLVAALALWRQSFCGSRWPALAGGYQAFAQFIVSPRLGGQRWGQARVCRW
jgi:hypothetical protein